MATQEQDLFKKIGIDIEDEKISIDLGKTKSFFNSLQQMLQQKAQAVQKDLQEGKLDMKESVGIKIDDEHIDIDLGKTKQFFETLGKQIEGFVSELDKTVENTVKKIENTKE